MNGPRLFPPQSGALIPSLTRTHFFSSVYTAFTSDALPIGPECFAFRAFLHSSRVAKWT
eukprot:CAMPEP_0115755366 /NCGR_PEP_ID=MMETSP0272-20121206/97357_1 /TAXON_ID=71861 /ORGANISM="Scrippsiella trochoidea, Strain CCMP3099" /LENGTH=58 /DNA_ID=CAMNT_0003200819 /DNA_START=186 /DNA_END=359 /DNA_ORIENTATION=+